MLRFLFCLILSLSSVLNLSAQDNSLVQLSGIIYTRDDNKIKTLPYAEISIRNTFRVVYGNESGFFSIPAQRGDTIDINYLSYVSESFIIPNDFQDDKISLNQLMNRDTIFLPRAVIHPWPDKEHFKPEFLAMDVEETMQDIANANLAQDKIREMMLMSRRDGQENVSLYLSQQAQKYYYAGQIPPQKIFSPGAWIEFFRAWKRGDFKKKKR